MGWNVDLPRLIALNKYWNQYPPIQVLIAAYLGYKPPENTAQTKSTEPQQSQEEAMAAFFATVPMRTFEKPRLKPEEIKHVE